MPKADTGRFGPAKVVARELRFHGGQPEFKTEAN
jgi:hypothetical protein